MRTLLLLMMVVASVGPAFIYRLAKPSFEIAVSRSFARRLSIGLLTTAVLAILLIGLGIPLRPGPVPLAVAAVLCGMAAVFSVIAWRQVAGEEWNRPRFIFGRVVAPTLGCVGGIMLASFIALPAGWRWV